MLSFSRQDIEEDLLSHTSMLGQAAEALRQGLVSMALWRLLPCLEEVQRRMQAATVDSGGPPEARISVSTIQHENGCRDTEYRIDCASGRAWTYTRQDSPSGAGLYIFARLVGGDILREDDPNLWLQTRRSEDAGEARYSLNGNSSGRWVLREFCDDLRPLLAFAEPRPEVARPRVYNAQYLPDLVRLDGGLPGPVSLDLLARVEDKGLLTAVVPRACRIVANIQAMTQAGYTTDTTRLAYCDTDRRLAAIPCANPRQLAQMHENIDLSADDRRFVLLVTLDDQGDPVRLDAWGIPCSRRDEARSSRPSLLDLRMRLRTGAAMPVEPTLSVDLVTHTTTRGADFAASLLPRYLDSLIDGDKRALERVAAGDRKGIREYRGDDPFPDEDETADADTSLPTP